MKSHFKCAEIDDKGYCVLWLRMCPGYDNCTQGHNCTYCAFIEDGHGEERPETEEPCKSCADLLIKGKYINRGESHDV